MGKVFSGSGGDADFLGKKVTWRLFKLIPCSAAVIPSSPSPSNHPRRLSWVCVHAQSCLPLCSPMDWRPPGSSVHGISQARILEWVAISSSRGSSPPSDRTLVSYIYLHWQVDSLPLSPSGKPQNEPTNMEEQKIFKKFFTDTPFKGWRKKSHLPALR